MEQNHKKNRTKYFHFLLLSGQQSFLTVASLCERNDTQLIFKILSKIIRYNVQGKLIINFEIPDRIQCNNP